MNLPSMRALRRKACRCGPPPELCVPDDEQVTQYCFPDEEFHNAPRIKERDLSLQRGKQSVEELEEYILGFPRGTGRVRSTAAGIIRSAGLAVVHTPGKLATGTHVSIVWPADDPLTLQEIPWPPDISARFDACFNEEEGVTR